MGLYLFSSCGINSNLMFREGKDFQGYDSIPMTPEYEYRIAPYDEVSFQLLTNDGEKIIDQMSLALVDPTGQSEGSGGMRGMRRMRGSTGYLVRHTGIVELPVLGEVYIAGKTIVEAQELLKSLYSKNYINPFVVVEVSNARVFVFNGSGSGATVVGIHGSTYMTLLEALAKAGGITDRGKAKKIRIMRQTPKGRQVYLVDLSTMKGLQYADMILQANDIIYVEPVPRILRETLKEISPVMSLVSSTLFFITLIGRFN
jgi:polysaccharide export outer membrane protein